MTPGIVEKGKPAAAGLCYREYRNTVIRGEGSMLRVTATWIVVAGLAARCCAEEAKVPLKTEIPEEVLVGTPPRSRLDLVPA